MRPFRRPAGKWTGNALLLSLLILAKPVSAVASDTVAFSGDLLALLLPLGAVAATVYHHDGTGAQQYGEAVLAGAGTVYTLKYTVDKARPDGSDNDAFPSGHTAAAFSGAAFLQMRYDSLLAIPAYLAAAYVGWSRIEAKKHDVADVLGGAAVGVAAAYLFTDRFGEETALLPIVGDHTYGLLFRARF